MRIPVAAAVFVAALFVVGRPAADAANGHWQPPSIRPVAFSLDAVLARTADAVGVPSADYRQRVEHWTLSTGPATLHVLVTVRDTDVRFDTPIDGATYSQGRSDGFRWRRTPNGLVRRIGADVQGDDLDRWPLALFPFARSDCALLGETTSAPAAWVIEYRPAHDSPHWFYVDETTGRVTREILREGSRNVTFVFSDFRHVDGMLRPLGWHISGAGGEADVSVEAVTPQPIADEAVALPPSTDATATFSAPSVVVPAGFHRDRIGVDAVVNGHRAWFVLDTGTTQILIDKDAARRFGLRPTLGHAIVDELSTGGVTFHDLAAQTVPLSGLRADGILGYDYFCGHVVHIDYGRGRIELIESNDFAPPSDARPIAADFDEAMPIVAAQIGSIATSRVVLDTGSPNVVLLRDLYGGDPTMLQRIGVEGLHGSSELNFLEGTIDVADANVGNIDFAGMRFKDDRIQVQHQASRAAVDFPIDAIFGTQVLHKFEWWFDYDDGRIWIRPV